MVRIFLSLVIIVVAATAVAASDRAMIRGIVVKTNGQAREVRIQSLSGENILLVADGLSRLSINGQTIINVDKISGGTPVRVTYEKAAIGNRIVSLRASTTKADISRQVREALEAVRGYTFAEKEKYQDAIRNVIDSADDQIDDLKAQAKDASGEARERLDQHINELKKKRDELENRLERARPAAADAWDQLRSGVAGAAEDLGRAFDRFRTSSK